jgi:hypothetical protein
MIVQILIIAAAVIASALYVWRYYFHRAPRGPNGASRRKSDCASGCDGCGPRK